MGKAKSGQRRFPQIGPAQNAATSNEGKTNRETASGGWLRNQDLNESRDSFGTLIVPKILKTQKRFGYSYDDPKPGD